MQLHRFKLEHPKPVNYACSTESFRLRKATWRYELRKKRPGLNTGWERSITWLVFMDFEFIAVKSNEATTPLESSCFHKSLSKLRNMIVRIEET